MRFFANLIARLVKLYMLNTRIKHVPYIPTTLYNIQDVDLIAYCLTWRYLENMQFLQFFICTLRIFSIKIESKNQKLFRIYLSQ